MVIYCSSVKGVWGSFVGMNTLGSIEGLSENVENRKYLKYAGVLLNLRLTDDGF